MKLILVLLLLIIVLLNLTTPSKSLETELQTQQQIPPPSINKIYTLLIKNDGIENYLNVYLYGNFSKSNNNGKKHNNNDDFLIIFNENIKIENFIFQPFIKNNSNNSSSSSINNFDLLLFRLYGDNIKSGNVSVYYNKLKSNEISFNLESIITDIRTPDISSIKSISSSSQTSNSIIELIGNFYFKNKINETNTKITINGGNHDINCKIISIDNSNIICLINNFDVINKIHNYMNNQQFEIKITNIHNLINQNYKFTFSKQSILIDRVIGIHETKESKITIIGNNFNNFNENLNVFIKSKHNEIRNCSYPPILITDSVYICKLPSTRSEFKTKIDDELVMMSSTDKTIAQDGSVYFIDEINEIDYIGGNSYINQSLILLAIILPSILIFIFIILVLILIFKKNGNQTNVNQNGGSYFKLIYCSNELEESTYN